MQKGKSKMGESTATTELGETLKALVQLHRWQGELLRQAVTMAEGAKGRPKTPKARKSRAARPKRPGSSPG